MTHFPSAELAQIQGRIAVHISGIRIRLRHELVSSSVLRASTMTEMSYYKFGIDTRYH